LDQSIAGVASGIRSGQARASAIGSRMSGGLAMAMVAPSVYSTMECTIDCGCTTDGDLLERDIEEQVGLDQLQALVTSVALFSEMTGPMFQVGWASACSG